MAIESLNNPFGGYGGIVSGKRFIGRKEEIKIIRERVLGEEFSNLAIVGLPAIGKSSLVYQCLVTERDKLSKQKVIVVFYMMGSTKNSLDFFKKLLKKTNEQFLNYFEEDEKYEKFALPIVEKINNSNYLEDIVESLESYFKKLRRWGYKIICILDEFDRANDIFEFEDFQVLRELSYVPENKICLITCSRKTLDDIEKKN